MKPNDTKERGREAEQNSRETEWKADPGVAQVVIWRQNALHRIRDTFSLSPAAIDVTRAGDGQMLGCQDGAPLGGGARGVPSMFGTRGDPAKASSQTPPPGGAWEPTWC